MNIKRSLYVYRKALAIGQNLSLTFISVVLCLLILEISMRLIHSTYLYDVPKINDRTHKMYEYDNTLGWRNRPNFKSQTKYNGREIIENINSRGWRDKEYALEKPEDTFRIASIGCSRTYGYGVNMEDSYPKILEKYLNNNSRHNIQVMNFGVNGYGLDQMLLNYKKYISQYNPDLILLQIYTPNIDRLQYRERWLTPKPKYVLKDGLLQLVNEHMPKKRNVLLNIWFREHSYLYRFIQYQLLVMKSKMETFAYINIATHKPLHNLSLAILKKFKSLTQRNGAQLLVFIWGEKEKKQWLIEIGHKANINIIRLEDFENINKWKGMGNIQNPPPTGHWSPLGNEFVAQAIFNYLVKYKKEKILFDMDKI